MINKVFIDYEKFLWLLQQKINLPRIPREISTQRSMEYITTEEKHISIGNLMTECALLFGFERRGAKIKIKLEAALSYLTENKKIEIIEEKIRLIGE